jgi:incFII family plasmid replication initiator RepA
MAIGLSIKNPHPECEYKDHPLEFINKLMKKADGVYSSRNFDYVVALARRDGNIKRRPRETSVRVLEALTQCALYHWDIVAEKVTTTAHNIAIKTKTATESAAKNFSISRVQRHLALLSRLGLIRLSKTKFRADLECYEPINFTFTKLFFDMLDVSEAAVVAARNSRVADENRKRKQKGLSILSVAELAAANLKKWIANFAEIKRKRKAQGELRYQRRKDAERTRKEIYDIEYRAALVRVRQGSFNPSSTQEFRDEVERRTNQRMITRKLDSRLSLSTA